MINLLDLFQNNDMRYGKYARAVRTVLPDTRANLRGIHYKSGQSSGAQHTTLLSTFDVQDTVLS